MTLHSELATIVGDVVKKRFKISVVSYDAFQLIKIQLKNPIETVIFVNSIETDIFVNSAETSMSVNSVITGIFL